MPSGKDETDDNDDDDEVKMFARIGKDSMTEA